MEEKKIERERMNIYITSDLKKKIVDKSNELGVNMSAFVTICVNEYIKQDSVVDMAVMFKQLQQQIGQAEKMAPRE